MQSAQGAGRLIAFRNDRLGARLIALVNAMRLAETTGGAFATRWIEATDIARSLNDPTAFFTPDFVAAHFLTDDDWRARRHNVARLAPETTRESLRQLLGNGRDVLVDNGLDLVVLAGEDAAEVRAAAAAIWRAFPFAEALDRSFAAARTAFAGSTAYHIRRGDMISEPRAMNRPWPGKYVPDDYYLAHMRRVMAREGVRPVLFCDDAPTVERFRAAFPALLPAATLIEGEGLGDGQRDLTELYAMSCCARIIAPSHSAFSSAAATLGGIPRLDVAEDIAPAEREAAGEALIERLAAPDPTAPAAAAGDTGQGLYHAAQLLAEDARSAEAGEMIARHLRAGLEISFLYPTAMQHLLEGGRPEAALEVAAIMDRGFVRHRRDFAAAEMLRATALLAQGARAPAVRHAANAFWHDPQQRIVREGAALLVAGGILDSQNFLPLSPALRALGRRNPPGGEKGRWTDTLVRLVPKRAQGARIGLPDLEPLGWEWYLFTRGFIARSMAGGAGRDDEGRKLAQIALARPGPDAESLVALHQAFLNPGPAAIDALLGLAEVAPGEAAVLHRLSAALMLRQDRERARAAADRAVAAAPGSAAHLAWRGLIRLRMRETAEAADDISGAIEGGLAFPGLFPFLAEAHRRLRNPEGVEAALDAGLRLAPFEPHLRWRRASYLAGIGRDGAAIEDLDVLERLGNQQTKTLKLHAELCERTGQPERAAGYLRLAASQPLASREMAGEMTIPLPEDDGPGGEGAG
jgi:hypothetical protein